MENVKGAFMRYILISLIISIICFIMSPSIITVIGVISGSFLGFFFALFGLSDDELQRLNNRKES